MVDSGGMRGRREERYTIEELERLSGYSPRTIRYYIARGLLQPAYGRGPTATYDRDHLRRLQYIDLLKQERMSLDQIREHLAEMEPADIEVALRLHRQIEKPVFGEQLQHMVKKADAGVDLPLSAAV